jgi:hypothetical protein
MVGAMTAAVGIGAGVGVLTDSATVGMLLGAALVFAFCFPVARRVQPDTGDPAHRQRLPYTIAATSIMLIGAVSGLAGGIPILARFGAITAGFVLYMIGVRRHPLRES